jgi:predicted permease
MGPSIRPLKEDVVGDVRNVLWVLMGTVGIVLLIACANVANLFLVRAEGRQQELAVRAAIGAGWGRLSRELLTESIGLSLAGGALGVGLAYAGLRLLVHMAPANLPRLGSISVNGPALLYTLAISLVAGSLFGLIPVIKFRNANLGAALRQGGRALSEGRGRYRARNVLVISQVALALVLLVSAGLMIRTYQALRHVNPGFARPSDIQTFRIPVPEQKNMKPEESAQKHQRILERIRQIPGVTAVAAASKLPMDGGGEHDPIMVEQFPTPEGQLPVLRTYKFLTPGFFETMGHPLLAGRDIEWNDIYGKRPVVLVSKNFALQYWKSPTEALGKRIRNSPTSPWRRTRRASPTPGSTCPRRPP